MAARSKWRTALRVARNLMIGILGLVLVVMLAAVIVLNTHWGRHKIVGVITNAVNASLVGHVEIGDLSGSLTHDLTITGVRLYDSEGQLAVAVERVYASYGLIGMLRGNLAFSKVELIGVTVHARWLKDDRLNFAALTKPSDAPSQPFALRIQVDDVRIAGKVRFELPHGTEPPVIDTTVDLQASAKIIGGKEKTAGPDVDVTVGKLALATALPLKAQLALDGNLHVKSGAISTDKVHLVVDAAGAQIRKLVPAVHFINEWHVDVTIAGDLSKMSVAVDVLPPKGSVSVRAQAGLFPRLKWQGSVDAKEFDVARAIADVPKGVVWIKAAGNGAGADGAVTVEDFRALLDGATAKAKGEFTFDGEVEGTADIAASDLSRLRGFGIPDMAGAIDARAKVARAGGHLKIDAKVDARKIAIAGNRVEHIDANIATVDLTGSAHGLVAGFSHGKTQITRAAFDAAGDESQFTFALSATGPKNLGVAIEGRGVPRYAQTVKHPHDTLKKLGTLRGADASIDELQIQLGNHETYALTGPAAITVEKGIVLSPLKLRSGGKVIEVHGEFEPHGKLDAGLKAASLDLNALAQWYDPTLALPKTSLDIAADVTGTSAAPRVSAAVHGDIDASKDLQTPALKVDIKARYQPGDVSADLNVSSGSQTLSGTVSVPLPFGKKPFAVKLDAKAIELASFQHLLPSLLQRKPDSVKDLTDGKIELALVAKGTVRDPDFEVHARLEKWRIGYFGGKGTALDFQYARKNAVINFASEVSATSDDQKNAHLTKITLAAKMGVDIMALGHEPLRALTRAPAHVDLTVAPIVLKNVPWALWGQTAPVDAGTVGLVADWEGSIDSPRATVKVAADKIDTPNIKNVAAAIELAYAKAAWTLRGDIDIQKQRLVNIAGAMNLPMATLIETPAKIKTTPVSATLTFPGFPLQTLATAIPNFAGQLTGNVVLKGPVAAPTGVSDLRITDLAVGGKKYSQMLVHADYADAHANAMVSADELGGAGKFRLTAVGTTLTTQPTLDATLLAQKFGIDLAMPPEFGLRLLKGQLDADAKVRLAPKTASLNGRIGFTQGQLGIAAQSRPFTDIDLDIKMADRHIEIVRGSLKAASGKAGITGYADLEGYLPSAAHIVAKLDQFPVAAGPFGIAVSATANITASHTGELSKIDVVVADGIARLPRISQTRSLQSLDDLEDVVFLDKKAERERAAVAKNQDSPTQLSVNVQIDKSFKLRSPDLNVDVTGNAGVDLSHGVTRVAAQIDSTTGWIYLLGPRYNIDRIRVNLDGTDDIDPALDIRITRDVRDATIIVEVHGTVRRPKVEFSSEPPTYSQSEILAMVISGSSGSASAGNTEEKIVGALAGAVVGQLKDKIAPGLPVDVVKIDLGGEDSTAFQAAKLEVGKFITENIYVSYLQKFGSVTTQRPVNHEEVHLEYRFLRRYTLQLIFGEALVGSIDLFWLKRF